MSLEVVHDTVGPSIASLETPAVVEPQIGLGLRDVKPLRQLGEHNCDVAMMGVGQRSGLGQNKPGRRKDFALGNGACQTSDTNTHDGPRRYRVSPSTPMGEIHIVICRLPAPHQR